jgi:hypothetical protein
MQGIRAHPGTPQGLLALVLTENTALFTAISNDVGYPAAFRRQVETIVRSEDLVIGLSTSGRSPNVLEAIRAARQIGGRTVALLGEQGELVDIADIAICIPSTSVPRIQEAHMLIGHLICEMAQRMTTGEYQTRFVPGQRTPEAPKCSRHVWRFMGRQWSAMPRGQSAQSRSGRRR